MLALDRHDHRPHPERLDLPNGPPPGSAEYPNTAGEYACGQEGASAAWLNLAEVQRAAHVRLVGKGRFDFSTDLKYNKTAFSLLDAYKTALIPRYRILQYSGDADPCVPYVGTKRWIDSLNLPIEKPWRPWAAARGGLVAGYTQIYAGEGIASTFTYTTVRNAGHMVPRYKPSQALHMIREFLHDTPVEAAAYV
mmetsp:Transcript_161995/g.393484  ORF Transcript_161995/g.393484 Transcript_161995/m.393484 type:complete len:194 (-) Transcript_161995:2-583(-)